MGLDKANTSLLSFSSFAAFALDCGEDFEVPANTTSSGLICEEDRQTESWSINY